MSSWDAVVIGAGPAGTLSASMLASAGAKTLLVEQERFPRGKLCGGCLATAGQGVLLGQGMGNLGCLRGAVRIERLDLRVGDARMRVRLPAYRVIDRTQLDAEMAAFAAEKGAIFRDGIRAIVRNDGEVGLEWKTGSEDVRASVVVVCDGIKGSSLRLHGGFGWRVWPGERVGLGGIADQLPGGCSERAVTMMCGRAGYAGVAPLADGRAVIAAAADPAWFAERASRGAGPLSDLLNELGLEGACDLGIHQYAGVPALRRSRECVEAEGRVFVVGDAAAYLEPFTGEGMSWALSSAERAHRFVMDAISGRYEIGSWKKAHSRMGRKLLCRATAAALKRPGTLEVAASVVSRVSLLERGVGAAVRALQSSGARAVI